jgi:hypothetical protein
LLSSFNLEPANYTLTQLRYDLRKLKAHGLLRREGRRYAYRLTDKGTRVALLFVLFHQRVCGPLANSLFHRRPTSTATSLSKIQAAYRKPSLSQRPMCGVACCPFHIVLGFAGVQAFDCQRMGAVGKWPHGVYVIKQTRR